MLDERYQVSFMPEASSLKKKTTKNKISKSSGTCRPHKNKWFCVDKHSKTEYYMVI